MRRSIQWAAFATIAVVGLLGLDAACAQEKETGSKPKAAAAAQPPILSGADLYSHILRGTALIVSDNGNGMTSNGTAWVIDHENCLLVTAAHCVDQLKDVHVYFPNLERDTVAPTLSDYLANEIPLIGRVIDTAPTKDLAIIRVGALPAETAELPLAPAEVRIDPGSTVGIIGNPTAVENTLWIYTNGAVRQVRRSNILQANGVNLRAKIVETTAPSNSGDSGAAVVNERGQVIGVHNGRFLQGRLRSMCVHVEEVREFFETVRPWVRPKSAEDFFSRGKNYLEKERFKFALRDFNKSLDMEPEKAEYYCARGEAHFGLKDFDSAADDLARAIKKNDELPDAYHVRGRCYLARGEYDNALDDFDQAIEISPKFSPAFAGKARLAEIKGDRKKAIDHLSDAIRHEPDVAKYYSERGRQYYALAQVADQASERENQNFKSAFDDLSDAIRLEGALPQYLEQRANILRDVGVYTAPGNYPSATQDYDNAIKYDAKRASLFGQRGIMYRRRMMFGDAIRDLESAIRLSEKREQATWYVEKGNTLLLAGKNKEAEKAFQKADSISPGSSRGRYKDLKPIKTRSLWIRNMANQPIEFYVLFNTVAAGGRGTFWFPGKPGSVEAGSHERYTVNPGESGQPLYGLNVDKPFPISATKVRVWGVGKTDGKRYDEFRDSDLVVVPDADGQYIAPKKQRWTYTFYD